MKISFFEFCAEVFSLWRPGNRSKTPPRNWAKTTGDRYFFQPKYKVWGVPFTFCTRIVETICHCTFVENLQVIRKVKSQKKIGNDSWRTSSLPRVWWWKEVKGRLRTKALTSKAYANFKWKRFDVCPFDGSTFSSGTGRMLRGQEKHLLIRTMATWPCVNLLTSRERSCSYTSLFPGTGPDFAKRF